jgi:hypothetical protein
MKPFLGDAYNDSQEIVDDHWQGQIGIRPQHGFTRSRNMGHDVMLGQRVDKRKDAKRRKHLFHYVERTEAGAPERAEVSLSPIATCLSRRVAHVVVLG